MRIDRRLVILAAWVAAACSEQPVLQPEPGPRCLATCGCDPATRLEVAYFGAAGFHLRRGDDELLLGPFFSNVSLWRASPFGWGLASKLDVIHRYLKSPEADPDGAKVDVTQADAILVGHSHYDHLLDVPHIAAHDAPTAMIYANRTAKNILAAVDGIEETRVVAVDEKAWSDGDDEPTESDWIEIPDTRMRILPLRSMHAPHFLGLTFMMGDVEEPLEDLPTRSGGWKAGQTHAFLIDFRSQTGEVEYRIYYQDSATSFRVGMPPLSVGTVDLALPCVASYAQVQGHPETLATDVAPEHWLLGHWEDFFREYTQDPARIRSVPLTDVPGFLERLQAAGVPAEDVTLPLPGERFQLQRCP